MILKSQVMLLLKKQQKRRKLIFACFILGNVHGAKFRRKAIQEFTAKMLISESWLSVFIPCLCPSWKVKHKYLKWKIATHKFDKADLKNFINYFQKNIYWFFNIHIWVMECLYSCSRAVVLNLFCLRTPNVLHRLGTDPCFVVKKSKYV